MAINFSNPFSSVFTPAGVTLTQSYTVPSGADELLIFIYADNANATAPLPDLVEYGGVNATLVSAIPTDAGGTGQLHFLYRILNPTAGTANLRVRHSVYYFAAGAVCISVDSASYTTTFSAFNYANSTSPSSTIASASGDKTLFSLTVNNVDTTAVSETGGQTVLSEGGSSSQAMHQLSQKTSAGATNSTTWTVSSGQRWSAIAINVHESAQTITSINGGSPITVGQTGVPIVHSGFTGTATSVTTNRAGVTATITAGDANSTTVNISGWADGSPYPVVDNNVTFTVSRSGESASGDQTLTRPANYDQVTFSGAITDDPNLIGYHLQAAGHVVEGGTFDYRNDQVATLTVLADTDWTSDPAGGTFSAVFIPGYGATAGNAYLFDITVMNGAIVSVVARFLSGSLIKGHFLKGNYLKGNVL